MLLLSSHLNMQHLWKCNHYVYSFKTLFKPVTSLFQNQSAWFCISLRLAFFNNSTYVMFRSSLCFAGEARCRSGVCVPYSLPMVPSRTLILFPPAAAASYFGANPDDSCWRREQCLRSAWMQPVVPIAPEVSVGRTGCSKSGVAWAVFLLPESMDTWKDDGSWKGCGLKISMWETKRGMSLSAEGMVSGQPCSLV